MTARRMLLGAAAGPFSPSAAFALTAPPHGGHTQTQGPHGTRHGDYLYFGDVNGSTGEIEIAGWNLETGAAIGPIIVHAALSNDTHDAPSLHVRRSDHRLMVWYSGENGAEMYQRVSVNSLDSDPTLSGGFASETTLDSSLGGIRYTYPQVGQLADGTLVLSYRDFDDPGADARWLAYSTSTDDGATWAAQTRFTQKASDPTVVLYQMVHIGATRVDFAISNGNGVTGTHVSVFHAYLESGVFHKSDGTVISAGMPWDPSSATLVHDGSAYPNAWPSGMSIDDTGAPVILGETLDTANGSNYAIEYWRYAGGVWTATTISTFSDAGLVLIAHSALSEDGATIWTVEPVTGVFELWEHKTADHGATWMHRQVTFGSSAPGFVYPANVENPDPRIRGLVLGGGPYVGTDDNSLGVYGIGRAT